MLLSLIGPTAALHPALNAERLSQLLAEGRAAAAQLHALVTERTATGGDTAFRFADIGPIRDQVATLVDTLNGNASRRSSASKDPAPRSAIAPVAAAPVSDGTAAGSSALYDPAAPLPHSFVPHTQEQYASKRVQSV